MRWPEACWTLSSSGSGSTVAVLRCCTATLASKAAPVSGSDCHLLERVNKDVAQCPLVRWRCYSNPPVKINCGYAAIVCRGPLRAGWRKNPTLNPLFQDQRRGLLVNSLRNGRLPGSTTNGACRLMPVTDGQVGCLTEVGLSYRTAISIRMESLSRSTRTRSRPCCHIEGSNNNLSGERASNRSPLYW
jgi:hypothetical protein